MLINANAENAENAKKKVCELCDFICCKQSEWNRHIITLKHKNAINCYTNAKNVTQQFIEKISCPICSKQFKHHSSMSRHKKNCNIINKNASKIACEMMAVPSRNPTGL